MSCSRALVLWSLAACVGLWTSPAQAPEPANARLRAAGPAKEPLGLPPRVWPAANPYSAAKAELGRRLFFDTRLSADGTLSCASCHDSRRAFTDGRARSVGIRGQVGSRSAPTLVNRAYGREQFWDGRAASLEEQVAGPITHPGEMASTPEGCVAAVRSVPRYASLFADAFGSPEISFPRIALAIATFERTLLSGNSPFDRYSAGEKRALGESARRGANVFFKKADCDRCHFGPNFTDGSFANVGIGIERAEPDTGRYAVLGREMDWGAFKVPTLREIARTAPYMHDGSLATLAAVVEHYDRGGVPGRNLDRRYRPLGLTPRDKADLVQFLESLSGEGWQQATEPSSLLLDRLQVAGQRVGVAQRLRR